MDKDKKSLSPRAQKLLDEIVQENSSVHETPKSEIGKDILKEPLTIQARINFLSSDFFLPYISQ